MPTHTNPTMPGRKSGAPYNFIPLPTVVLAYGDDLNPFRVDQGRIDPKRLTGWIDVTVETRTPLYIRAGLSSDDYERMELQEADPNDATPHLGRYRNRPEFFHTGDPDSPVIPGSSLRGMIRSLVEILGQGGLAFVTDEKLIYRAVADMGSQGKAYRDLLMNQVADLDFEPRIRAGYLRQIGSDWYIHPAETVDGTSFARMEQTLIDSTHGLGANLTAAAWHGCYNACPIYFQVGTNRLQRVHQNQASNNVRTKRALVTGASATPKGAFRIGTLVCTGDIKGKHSEAVVYRPDPACTDATLWIALPDEMVSAYRNQVTDGQRDILQCPDGALQDWRPVFYLMQGETLVFFGHTPMFRVPYNRSPRDFLGERHSEDLIDLARAMFGQVRTKTGGFAGRVFFTDLQAQSGQQIPWLADQPIVIPRILSSPKPTSFQHYLTQSRPDDRNGSGLHTYNSQPSATTLRGHKRYWHQGRVTISQYAEAQGAVSEETDKVHTKIKPVREGYTFAGRVYFENLLPVELGVLWWALALPAPGDLCHSLGMGKPLGLGAIKITPTLHLIDPARRYEALFASAKESGEPISWQMGEQSADDVQKRVLRAVGAFETYALKGQGRNGKLTDFKEMPRIRQLLTMLRWPGVTPDIARYRRIQPNEYRGRPVLPDPDDQDFR